MKPLLILAATSLTGTSAFAHGGAHLHPHGDMTISAAPLIAAGLVIATALAVAKFRNSNS